MERNTLEKFFTGKSFVIPTYQRDYAWTQENIDDLLDDIAETIETKTSHYIGTFILSKVGTDGVYNVVDGQQRLTTLTMILNVVVNLLPDEPKIISRNTFIRDVSKKRWRLEPAGYNRKFFETLLEGGNPEPESKSQKLLKKAYLYIDGRIREVQKAAGTIEPYLDALRQLEVMEFVESDEGKAIRIFQTVNDRGRPLAIVEKAKSLLIYYSNRFLGGTYDAMINEAFGSMFRDFTRLKEVGEATSTRIDLIAQATFTEDSVMRYHFLSFPNEYYDFKPTTGYVLDGFLKKILRDRQSDHAALSTFIAVYVQDLRRFFNSFLKVVERVETQPRYYKLLSILGLSTHLYPLLIRLQWRDLLDELAVEAQGLTFADLVEVADVRIYKTRGTDPAKDISFLARDAATEPAEMIARRLGEIVRRFMSDSSFEGALLDNMYANQAVVHVLIEAGAAWAKEQGRVALTVDDLKVLKHSDPTVEHVFAETPTFGFPGRGFDTAEHYFHQNHRLGNLSVLERGLNSRCQDKTPEQKLELPNLYKESRFDVTQALVAEVAAGGKSFDAKSVEDRTRRLAAFTKERWPVWE